MPKMMGWSGKIWGGGGWAFKGWPL